MSRGLLVKLGIAVAVLVAASVGGAAYLIHSVSAGFADSPIVRAAVVRARIDSRVYAAIGTPVEAGSIGGQRTRSGGWESMDARLSLRGPSGEVSVELEGEARGSGDVHFSRLEAVLPGGRVDLLRPVDPPVVESDEDCRHSAECRDDGKCKHRDGRCFVADWEDCKASAACAKDGRCYLEAGECRPITEEHCEASEGCSEHGRCALASGRCTYPADYCKNQIACLDDGACTLKGDRCIAASDGDCALASACPNKGLCYAKNGKCVALPGLLPGVGGKVVLGKPAVNGKLAVAAVESGLKAADEALLGCYQRALVRDSKLRARLGVRFVIARDGTVSNLSRGGGSTLRDEQTEICMRRALETAKFPAPESGIVTVLVGVQLEP